LTRQLSSDIGEDGRYAGHRRAVGGPTACHRPRRVLTNGQWPVRPAHPSVPARGPKAKGSAKARRPRCRDCPCWGAFGECLDHTLRSGRCGDWVFQVLSGNKQVRHLYVKPRDPRTPRQRACRKRLALASRGYSKALTPEQQDACIAAGAKQRSRPRLDQSGPLTGQQYWVSQQRAPKPEPSLAGAPKPTGALQTKGISAPTSESPRVRAVWAPVARRRRSCLGTRSRQAGKEERFRYHTPEGRKRIAAGKRQSSRLKHLERHRPPFVGCHTGTVPLRSELMRLFLSFAAPALRTRAIPH
jgi:hypothetical protein